jgi:transcription antitermination protein NusB
VATTPDPFGGDVPTVRREARERAVALLYEAHMKEVAPGDLVDGLDVPGDPLTVELVRGVADHVDQLDAHIDALLRDDWRPDRIALLDRIVLRIAGYELDHRPQVPKGAVINEAVELAKRFGATDQTPRFVNGVLAAWGGGAP